MNKDEVELSEKLFHKIFFDPEEIYNEDQTRQRCKPYRSS